MKNSLKTAAVAVAVAFSTLVGVPVSAQAQSVYLGFGVGNENGYTYNHSGYYDDYRDDDNDDYYDDIYRYNNRHRERPEYRQTSQGGKMVCLVTFFKRSQVNAGADVTVRRAQLLPLRAARRLDGPNDRNRIFDYGTNRQNRDTCRYLNNINN